MIVLRSAEEVARHLVENDSDTLGGVFSRFVPEVVNRDTLVRTARIEPPLTVCDITDRLADKCREGQSVYYCKCRVCQIS